MASAPALVRVARAHPLGGLDRSELIERLRRLLSPPRVLEALLFGSVASGDWTNDSDVDLLLVRETCKPFFERYEDFDDLFELVPRLDLLVYTPDEIASLRSRASVGFWRSVLENNVRIV